MVLSHATSASSAAGHAAGLTGYFRKARMPRFETLLTEDEIKRYSSSGYWPNQLITDCLDRAALATPEKIAIIDSGRSITYRELLALADRCAQGLIRLGLGPGDVMSIQLPNWIEFAVAYLAAARIGVVSCLITPMHRDREVAHMLNLAEAKLALVPECLSRL